MGGFCAKRDWCRHYHAENRREPAERLCPPGADGVGIEAPIELEDEPIVLQLRPLGTA
jgi:hypothetical protein